MSNKNVTNPSSNQVVIKSDGKRRAIMLLIFAVIWNLAVVIGLSAMWPQISKIFEENPITYLLLLFPLIGILMLYSSIKSSMEWFRYGEVPLTLNTNSIYIGEVFSGYIDLKASFGVSVNSEVSLRCAHHYSTQAAEEGSERVDYLWQQDLIVSSQSREGLTRFPVTFQINDMSLPPSGSGEQGRYEWSIVAKLPAAGKELIKNYVIPVEKYNV